MIGARTAGELATAAGGLAVLACALVLVARTRAREAAARRRAGLLAEAGALLDRDDPLGSLDALARDFARRAGVSVDHARRFGALEQTEASLQAVLGALAEAVTVQRADGRLVYANRAAAALLGAADEHALLERGAEGAWEGWDV